MGMGELPPCAMGMGEMLPYFVVFGEIIPYVVGARGLSLCGVSSLELDEMRKT